MLRHLKIKTRNDESNAMMMLKATSSINLDDDSHKKESMLTFQLKEICSSSRSDTQLTTTDNTKNSSVIETPDGLRPITTFSHQVSKGSSIISSITSTSSSASSSSDSCTSVMALTGCNIEYQHDDNVQRESSRVVIIGLPDDTTNLQLPQALNNDSRGHLSLSLRPEETAFIGSPIKRKTISSESSIKEQKIVATSPPIKKARTTEISANHNPSTISLSSQETRSALSTNSNDDNFNQKHTYISAHKFKKNTNTTIIGGQIQNDQLSHFRNIVERRPTAPAKSSSFSSLSQVKSQSTSSNTLGLLALPEDALHLSPLHCFVRKNIEVFTATAVELSAPSPGRRAPIRLGQVGLRCIHCTRNSHHIKARGKKKSDVTLVKRTKRTVCYPSSTLRIYHTVSDMKFDHFTACQFLPEKERQEFNQLREQYDSHRNSKGNHYRKNNSKTANYYQDAARQTFGMIDTPNGIFTIAPVRSNEQTQPKESTVRSATISTSFPTKPICFPYKDLNKYLATQENPSSVKSNSWNSRYHADTLNTQNVSQVSAAPSESEIWKFRNESLPTAQYAPIQTPLDFFSGNHSVSFENTYLPMCNLIPSDPLSQLQKLKTTDTLYRRILATPQDESNLNELHCFVRKNIHVFVANENDIAAPSPGRKKPLVNGQVGIRCIHCVHLPYKDRVKRAVCYPPSVSMIYHAVSNMKFDHFGACRGLPRHLREDFQRLKEESQLEKDQKTLKNKPKSRNSTSQYYCKSALDIGLVDTDTGLRFRGKNANTYKSHQSTSPDLVSSNMSPFINSIPMKPKPKTTLSSDSSSRRTNAPTNTTQNCGMSLLMHAATDPHLRNQYNKNNQNKATYRNKR